MRALRYLHVAILLAVEAISALGAGTSGPENAWLSSTLDVQKQIGIKPLGQKAAGDGWTAQEQDGRVCDAGSRQFTGRVNVTEGKSIFFCKSLTAGALATFGGVAWSGAAEILFSQGFSKATMTPTTSPSSFSSTGRFSPYLAWCYDLSSYIGGATVVLVRAP